MQVDNDHSLKINNALKDPAKTPIKSAERDCYHADITDYLKNIQQHLFVQPSNKTALIYGEQSISYAELADHVAQMMLALDRLQLKAAAVVAICLHKSPAYIYSVLACALKGIIWLPIDMDSPASRRAYLLANSQVDLVISNHAIDDYAYLLMDDVLTDNADQHARLNPAQFNYQINRDAAYYLYTSGSTGTPKCVVLNNQATANVIEQTVKQWQLTADDVIMAVTPFHHDMSVFDVYASIALGATLLMPTLEQTKNAVAWATLLETHKVTVWVSVPAIVDMLCSVASPAQLQSLRLIAQGGDYIKPHLIKKLRSQLPNTRLFSLGGPTETTIWSIWHEIVDQDQHIIPYGQALKYNQYFILDENLQICPLGEVGRMYMTGINLSNGYLLDGKLITKDFVHITNADGSTATAFRMSDLGYVRADGTIIFAGREEGYLKIKGVRIAAAEVETALLQHTPIQDIVVVCCTHPETKTAELVAVFSSTTIEQKIDVSALNMTLKKQLPSSHIPTKWHAVDQLPLTTNGKIDRKLLQKMAQQQLYPLPENLHHQRIELNDIADTVINIFRQLSAEQQGFSPTVFYQTDILALGIRSKQLKKIAETIAEKYAISIDFYALVRCKTVQDVINHVQLKAQQ